LTFITEKFFRRQGNTLQAWDFQEARYNGTYQRILERQTAAVWGTAQCSAWCWR